MMGKLFLVLFIPQIVHAGHFVGNGGDYLRATYIRMGGAVLSYLQDTQEGAQILSSFVLSVSALEESLDIHRIKVTDQVLRDNTGSVVDALGVPGLVTLNQEAWLQHFENERDVYYLVFHEMLRSAAVNDDGYIVSKLMNPFPYSRRIATRVTPALPLIKEDLLEGILDLKSVAIAGTGCARQSGQVYMDFDSERNILHVRPTQFRNEVGAQGALSVRSCQLVVPVAIPGGKRLTISQIDLLGKVDILPGASARLGFEAFLAGSSAPRRYRVLSSKSPLYGRVLTRRTEVLKSKCGGHEILRLNSSIHLFGSGAKPENFQIDNLSLYLNLEDCR